MDDYDHCGCHANAVCFGQCSDQCSDQGSRTEKGSDQGSNQGSNQLAIKTLPPTASTTRWCTLSSPGRGKPTTQSSTKELSDSLGLPRLPAAIPPSRAPCCHPCLPCALAVVRSDPQQL